MEEFSQATLRRIAIAIGTVVTVVLFLIFGVERVPERAVGIKVSNRTGVQQKTLDTGYHFTIPFFERIYTIPTGVQSIAMTELTTQTKDGQWLSTNLDVKYRVNPSKAMNIFSDYKDLETVNNTLISPAVQRAIESVSVEYDIYEVLGSERSKMYEKVDAALKKSFEKFDLEFVSFTITDQDAGDEIEAAMKDEAVKQKAVDAAKQDQEKARIAAETQKIEAQAAADAEVIRAQGQAEANAKLSGSITDELIRMKEAEAREKHGWVEVTGVGNAIVDTGK